MRLFWMNAAYWAVLIAAWPLPVWRFAIVCALLVVFGVVVYSNGLHQAREEGP